METNRNLTSAIIKALAFFDMYDYALTFDELHRYLEIKCDPTELQEALKEMTGEHVHERAGVYFLIGRESLTEKIDEFNENARKKYAIAMRVAGVLKYLSGVRMLAVCNSLARGVAGTESDIDLFIILKKGRIWSLRLLITLIVHALGVRRYGAKITDRICLSFYIADDHLNVYEYEDQDLDFYWLSTMKPLYDDGAYAEFIKANDWLYQKQPNFSKKRMKSFVWQGDSLASAAVKKIFGVLIFSPLGTIVESLVKKIQLLKIRSHKNSRLWRDGNGVVVNDSVLKFHEKDDREEYRQRLGNKIDKLLPHSSVDEGGLLNG